MPKYNVQGILERTLLYNVNVDVEANDEADARKFAVETLVTLGEPYSTTTDWADGPFTQEGWVPCCEGCQGWAFFDADGVTELQRCDACDRFPDDAAAAEYAVPLIEEALKRSDELQQELAELQQELVAERLQAAQNSKYVAELQKQRDHARSVADDYTEEDWEI